MSFSLFLQLLLVCVCLLLVIVLVLQVLLWRRSPPKADSGSLQLAMRDELAKLEQNLRQEINNRLDATRNTLDSRLDRLSETMIENLGQTRQELAGMSARGREEGRQQLAGFQTTIGQALVESRQGQNQQLQDFATRLGQLQSTISEALTLSRKELGALAEATRTTLDRRLEQLSEQNAAKLEQMRLTVDEKLQTTLEKRLGESFKLVGDNLEKVIRSLGEMQAVAADVGDLKRVLTNVKTRGTWGETQLALLLENFLQADQYAANVRPNPHSEKIVEFAVKLPGQVDDKPLWLPLDSKFPREDYERLVNASEQADSEGAEQAGKALAASIEASARDIRDKYIVPPHTTDFAILFLPTEGLYAEVLRRPGLADKVQREYRVLIAGPTTLAALLNALQQGFRTLAIQKRSADIWKTLGTIKAQFGLFGDLLEKVQKRLDDAGKAVGEASDRHRIMTNRLAKVESLPGPEVDVLTTLEP